MAELMRDVAYRDIVTGRRAARGPAVHRGVLFGRLILATNTLVEAGNTGRAWDLLCAWTEWADVAYPLEGVNRG